MSTPQKINWYHCKVDKAVMSELNQSSDWKDLLQCLLQPGLFLVSYLINKKQKADPTYFYAPPIPINASGERIDDDILQQEAAARA